MLPVAEHTDALEALHLHVDIVLGELVAGGAEGGNGHGLVVELVLLDDGALDGHAVVVPAGDIGRVVAAHRVGTGDEVLQGLVERVTHVQSTVGERRAIVQGEAGLALVFFEHQVIEVHFLPVLEHLRLALGKTRAHREAGLGHIQRAFVIHVASPYIYMNFDLIVVAIAGNSFLPRRVRGKNSLTQPPWAATPVTCVTGAGDSKGGMKSPSLLKKYAPCPHKETKALTSAVPLFLLCLAQPLKCCDITVAPVRPYLKFSPAAPR